MEKCKYCGHQWKEDGKHPVYSCRNNICNACHEVRFEYIKAVLSGVAQDLKILTAESIVKSTIAIADAMMAEEMK